MLDRPVSELSKPRRCLPDQRWQIYPQKPEFAQNLAALTNISPIVSQLLINRGMETPEQVRTFLNPESLVLPSPLEDFPDLAISLELLQNAIASQTKIAICGDYDADGMTSTALLLRSLRTLGAQVDYA
ncbi:single-stranded-DNA-specific exonuclease RecJ, partial [Nostoc sp. CHAB 5715]|nr:single-stranded-DNA-specific exonuclease RecJ [Nostoc sp. CHAB 5715]